MSTTTPNPIPDSYRRVTPCLVVQGAAKALEFYAEVFQATERMRFPGPDGRIAHAEIQIGDSVVIVDDESPEREPRRRPPEASPAHRPRCSSTSSMWTTWSREPWSSARRWFVLPRTSSTATGTATSSTRSGMGGRSQPTWRTWRRRR